MNQISWREVLTCLGVAAVVMVGAAQLSAAPLITVEISSVGSGDPYSITAEGTPNGDGTFTLARIGEYGTNWFCDWAITVNPDPSITGTFNLTNLSATTQTFVLTVSLPVPLGLGPTTVMGGYVGLVEYFDQNDSDVTLASVGASPIYQARIGVTAVQDLLAGTFQAFGGPGANGSISQLSWGTPIPSAPGPAIPVAGNMNIRTTFSLTGLDRVRLPVNFVVEPVPEPGSLVLIGIGLAALAGVRARRS